MKKWKHPLEPPEIVMTRISNSALVAAVLGAWLVSCSPSSGSLKPGAQADGGVTPGTKVDPNCVPSAEICDGADNNCDGRIDEGFDQDADGTTSCGGDCNDSDSAIHPG